MITIPLKATIICPDGDFGQTMYIIINPAILKVTHLVVKKIELPQREIIVPVDWVFSTTPGSVFLDHTWEELEKRETFNKDKFIKESDLDNIVYSLNALSGNSSNKMPSVDYKGTSPLRLILSRKTCIKALDGHIGSLDDLVTKRIDGTITHLVLGKGRFLGKEEVLIPISQIERFEADTVYLKLNREALETLPSCKGWKYLLLPGKRPDLIKENNKKKDTVSQKIFSINSKNKRS